MQSILNPALLQQLLAQYGQTSGGQATDGLLAQIPQAQAPAAAPFVPTGPYGQQAMQMAGLLQQPPAEISGPPKGFRIPGGRYGQ